MASIMTLTDFIFKASSARKEFEASWSDLNKRPEVPQKKILAKYFDNQVEIEIADFLIKLAPENVEN
jgi:hypothetical protein